MQTRDVMTTKVVTVTADMPVPQVTCLGARRPQCLRPPEVDALRRGVSARATADHPAECGVSPLRCTNYCCGAGTGRRDDRRRLCRGDIGGGCRCGSRVRHHASTQSEKNEREQYAVAHCVNPCVVGAYQMNLPTWNTRVRIYSEPSLSSQWGCRAEVSRNRSA